MLRNYVFKFFISLVVYLLAYHLSVSLFCAAQACFTFLLLGTSKAAKFLRANGITLTKVREEILELLGKSDMFYFTPENPPLTEQAQKAIDWVVEEKLKSGMILFCNYVIAYSVHWLSVSYLEVLQFFLSLVSCNPTCTLVQLD